MTNVADLFVLLHRLNEDLTFDVSLILVENLCKCMYTGNLQRKKRDSCPTKQDYKFPANTWPV
jgi:hypothetical protein